MARMAPEHQDARERAQALINLEVRRWSRRLKQAAEDFISDAYSTAMASGKPFDHAKVAEDAVKHASVVYGVEVGPSSPQIESGAEE